MALHETVRFSSGGGSCEGDLHLPDPCRGRVPVVVMAHGLGAERTFGLRPFVERFVARGLAVLVFDYRHFGGSTGEPRLLISPSRQLADFRSALGFVRSHAALDGGRIALWGTSFSGGHVLRIASERPAGLRAVVAQVPFVSGLASTFAFPLRYHLPAIALGVADEFAGLVGGGPIRVPVVPETGEGDDAGNGSAGGFAVLASPDSRHGYGALVDPAADWSGRVPARVFLRILAYHPNRSVDRIQVPTLIVGATDDAVCPIGATRRAARRVPKGELREFPIGHFDAYTGEWFERIVAVEAAFLERLSAPG